MSLKLNHSLLEENIALKRENNKLLAKIDDMNTLLKKVSNQISDLSNKPVNTIVVRSDEKISEQSRSSTPERIFIPTPSGEGMTTNIGDIKTKTKISNISDSVKKLSEVNDPD